ncbi:hypothetical protein CDAR_533292 [Caerostris darwini]|uniref:dTCF n=1 Tax=Caerostris darwini TaxID=1538125 RepID=A0AAV4WXK2_9ARAC|nr:hypothetical protein CDAR_533292 [Caerostris darwini]
MSAVVVLLPGMTHFNSVGKVSQVPLVTPSHTPPHLSYLFAEQCQPPPAHMGISHLNQKSGIGRPSVFPLAPPNQYHPPVFSSDFSSFPWPPNAMYPMAPSFRSSPYPPPIPANLQGRFSPYPGIIPPSIHPSMHHPMMGSGPKVEIPDTHERPPGSFNHHSPSTHPLSQTQNIEHMQNEPNNTNKKKVFRIKKPLNAFMLYMRDMRPVVMKDNGVKESAAINRKLGKMWHNVAEEVRIKYHDMARIERERHMARYPNWTARDNYACNAKKKKRKRNKSGDGDGNNLKKCRARYGLDKQNSWCKPCRRKKKCIRYCNGSDNTTGESEDNIGSVESMNSLEAPTPDSLYSTETNDNDGNDSRNHELESSEFSLSSPPAVPTHSILSPKTVPRLPESVQSLNGDSQLLKVQNFMGDHPVMEEGDLSHVALPTPPSTDSSTTTTVSS